MSTFGERAPRHNKTEPEKYAPHLHIEAVTWQQWNLLIANMLVAKVKGRGVDAHQGRFDTKAMERGVDFDFQRR